jgi:hypothetical protein
VEVNYLGCGSWYPAVFVQAIDGVSSKIRYVDGDQDEEVQNDWIRSVTVATGEVSSPDDIQLDTLGVSKDESVSLPLSAAATESNTLSHVNHKSHYEETDGADAVEMRSPQSDNLSLYDTSSLNGQLSIASTVTSIGAVGSADADIEYEHKRGIGGDDCCSLTSYEILHALGRLHGVLTKRYTRAHEEKQEQEKNVWNRLSELTLKYYSEASTEAFDSGKTAFAMKCVEDAAEYE